MRQTRALFIRIGIGVSIAIGLLGSLPAGAGENPQNVPQVVKVEGDVEHVHDPSIAKDGDALPLADPVEEDRDHTRIG